MKMPEPVLKNPANKTRTSKVKNNTDDWNRSLRQLNSVVAFATGSAQAEPSLIGKELADAVTAALELDLTYVRLVEPSIEVVASATWPDTVNQAPEIGNLLANGIAASRGNDFTWSADLFGKGVIQLITTAIGTNREYGIVVAGSQRPGFPTAFERPLLAIGANQAAVALQNWRLQQGSTRTPQAGAEDFFEAAAVPLHWLAPDGTILRANRAELDLLGYSKEEYVGRNIADFCLDEALGEDFRQRMARRETLHHYEALLRCKNGAIRYVLIDSNVLWENGNVIHAQCFTRDITDQKKTEGELKALNATLEERVIQRSGYIRLLQEVAVAANEADALETALQFAVDRLCAHQEWPVGHACLLAKDFGAQILAKPIWHLNDPERLEAFKQASDAVVSCSDLTFVGRVLTEGKPVAIADISADPNFTRSQEAASGGLKSGIAFPILIGKEVVAALEFFSDKRIQLDDELLKVMSIIGTQLGRVAERKRTEARLRESERLATMGKTAAVFAHEVANPLNGLSTTCQLLQRHFAKHKDDFASSTVENIQTEINRLTALLNNFRSLSRPQQLSLEKTDLVQLAKDVLTGAAVERNSNVQLVEDFAPEMPAIMADAERLKQVFLNLYKNALEAMPDGGTLTLYGRNSGNYLILGIADTGVGIQPGSDIFELFTTTKPNGTGLGLAIVRQIIAAHGGTITYTSEPGKGTQFIIALPVATP